ncbi:hypothetical protein BLNAU_11605 [Blattamonas nauphoetae]|uniref:Serine-threonine/tyrosine-protein kinase catalytic domain-containing protein n=1 Tax=Blattamonas nauphoetae TaxID=2049346 RepID=A0ABQ9XSF7_9EUKA|nr:hypothetical protein BLNAU_11605 [Blattamonas nauphoetae]
MIGSNFLGVDNALFGTVIPRLGSSLSLLSLNTTFVECSNVDGSQNGESFDFSVQSTANRSQFSSQQSAQHFENCHFTSTKPTSSFNVIEYTEFGGSLKFVGSSFKIVVGTKLIGVMKIIAKKEVFPLFLFDTSSVTFSRSDGIDSLGSQFTFAASPNTHFASSNFTAPTSTSTCTRTLIFTSSIAFATITNCVFEKQSTASTGTILNDQTLCSVVLITSSIFRENHGRSHGGVLYLSYAHARMFHCHFESNSAGLIGGCMYLIFPKLCHLEDVHFENNHANQPYSATNPTRTHYRGNDIGLRDGGANVVLKSLLGCTSTSVSPKIGFYYSTSANGNVTNEGEYLPNPTTTSLPTAAGEWWMSEDGDGETCSKATPCKTMSAVIAAISSSETTRTGFNKVNICVGRFSESVSPLSLALSVEFVGSGWDRNSSTFTTVELSLSVDGNANFSLTSLFLLPLSVDSPILRMGSTTAKVRLANVWIEGISSHETSLFSFSSGSATFQLCVLNTITLTSSSAISLTGSCSLSMNQCWVMEIQREKGDGGSVIDSSTSGTVSILESDFARCLSSGCSGCLSFSSSGSTTVVKLSSVYFSDNLGNQTDLSGITIFANDISFSGLEAKQISMSAVRSISPQPHCLTNSSNSSFDSIPLSFSDSGVDFSPSLRHKRGTPLTRLTTLNNLLEELVATAVIDIQIFGPSMSLQKITLARKRISLTTESIHLDLQNGEAITLLDSSTFQLCESKFTVPHSITSPPFILKSPSSRLRFYGGSVVFSQLFHLEAFIRNDGGTVAFDSSVTSGLHFEGHSFVESVGGSFSTLGTLFDSFSSTSDGAVLKAKGTSVKFSLASCVNCSARNGGALAIELSGASYLQIVHESTSKFNVTFKDCIAIGEEGVRTDPKGKGGAIFVNGSSTSTKPIQLSTTTSDDARFEENFADEGNDIFVSRSVFDGKSLDSISGFGGGSHSGDFRIVVEGLDSNNEERDLVQSKLLPSPKVSVNGSVEDVFGKMSGVDSDACKWTSSFCATLGFGVRFLTQRYLNKTSIPQTIQFVHNMTYTEKKIEIVDQDVTVVGTTSKDLSKSTISRSLVLIDSSISTGSYLFSVTDSGKLRVMNLDINYDSSSGVNSGPISMMKCVLNTTKGSSGSASFSSPILSSMRTNLQMILVETDVILADAVSVTTSLEIKSDTSTVREVDQQKSSSLEVDGLSAVLSLSSLAFSFTSTNTLVSFFVVKTGTLSITSCRIGDATTPQTLSNSMTSLFAVSSSGILTLLSTTFTNVRFSHPTSGSLIHLSLGASLIIDESSELSKIWSNGKGRIVFVESENLESTASLESFQNLKNLIRIPSSGSFSDSEKNDFVGKEGTNEESLLWHWFPHTASNSTVVVSSSGEDHPKCGLSLLPCHSVEHGFDSLKNWNSSLVLEKDDSLSSQLTTQLTSQTISSQTSRQTLTVTSSGSFSVSIDTSLCVISLSFVSTIASSSVSFVSVASGASLIVSDCSFTSFSSLVSGSVISGTIISGDKVEIGESEKETLFQSCSSLVDGGGMNVEVSGTGALVISKTKFEDCSAVRGGSIFLTLTRQNEQTSWSIDVSGSSFVSSSSSSNTDMIGKNIFVSGSFFESSINTNRFPEVSRTTDPNSIWGVDSESGVNSSLLVYLVGIEDEVVVDGIDGSEIGLCGHFGVSCSSIEKGLARAVPKDSSVTLFIHNTTSLTTPLTVGEFDLTFAGESSSQQVPVSSNGCFRLETGRLSLALIDFVSSIPSSSTSFVSVSSGASLAISSCSFDSFTSSCSGSVVSAIVSATSSLSVDLCSFINCTSSSSSGSGVLDVSFTNSASFTLSGQTIIDSCLSPSANSDFLLMSHPSLNKEIIRSSLTLTWSIDSTTNRSFVGKEGSSPKVVPLYLYFSSLSSEGHVNGLWSDVSVCGFVEYPCRTLPTLWTHMVSHTSVVVVLDGGILHSEEMVVDKRLNLVGNEHRIDIAGFASEMRKEGLFTISEDVSFVQTELSISSTFQHAHLFDVVDKSLNMDGCSISQTGTYTLEGSLIHVGEGASLVIAESLFSSIRSSDELGGVVVGTLVDGAKLKLDNNTFRSCRCSGEANCVWMELKNETSTPTFEYSMTRLIFEPSSSSSNSETVEMNVFVCGCGLDALITELKWEGSVDTKNPSSLWVWDRQTGVNSSLLPYLIPITECVEVDKSGWEFTKCGHFLLFCRTMEFGLDRMKSTEIEWMKIVDSVVVENEIEVNGTLTFSGSKSSSSIVFSNVGSFLLSKVGATDTSLTLMSLVFSVSSRSSQDPLFSSSDSTLIVTSCSFSTTQTLLSPLIRMNEGLLKMEEVNVSNMETSCALIDTLSGVEIVGCCFESISRSSNGPTILSASLSSDRVVRVKSTRFLDCLSNGVAWWVFLCGEEGRVEKESDWEGTFDLTSPRSGVQISRESVDGKEVGVEEGEDGDEEMVRYSLIYEFYPRGSKMFVSTEDRNVDHVLCGNMKVACRTVDGGFSATNEADIEIVGSGWLGSRVMVDGVDMKMQGSRGHGRLDVAEGGQIVNGENDELDSVSISSLSVNLDGSLLGSDSGVFENMRGTLVLSELNISCSCSKNCSLVRLRKGRLSIDHTRISSIISSSPLLSLSSFSSADLSNVTVLNWGGSTLLSGVNGESNISISSSLFYGMESPEGSNSDDLCLWESGLLSFENCSVDIHSSEFSHLRRGALFVSGGSLTIHTSSFEDNSAQNSDFPSAHRNIRCENGSNVSIQSLSGGDGFKDGSSPWISASSDCVLSGSEINPNTHFFIPSLSNNDCSSKMDKVKSSFNVSLVGTELIPCGLFFEVFEAQSDSKYVQVDLSSISTMKWNETSIVFSLSRSDHLSTLSMEEEWRGRVLYGNGERTSRWFVMKVSASAERKAQALNSMKWILPVVGGVIAGIVILVIVVCILARRKKTRGKKETETKQMEEIDEVEMKMEDPEEHWRNGSQNAIVGSTSCDSFSENGDKTEQNQMVKEDLIPLPEEETGNRAAEVVLAIRCGSETMPEATVEVRETLFSRLHKQQKRLTTVERGRIEKRVCEALALTARVHPTAEILSRLTSHWVLFDEKDEMFFRQEASEVMNPQAHTTFQTAESLAKQVEDEGQRWVPPEVADGKPVIDVVHGTVFRLGLLLWEIETGQIPFGEVDGINAQRQLGSGIVPRMDRVRDGLGELVTECLSIDPEKRPTLMNVLERVVSLNKNEEETEKMKVDVVNRDAFLLPSGSPPQDSPQHSPTDLSSPQHPAQTQPTPRPSFNPHLPPHPPNFTPQVGHR